MTVSFSTPLSPPQDSGAGHVLIADDQPYSRLLFSDLLISSGYQVSQAEDGIKALEAIERLRPDLVLLDVMMPGMDGYEVCRRLKNNDLTRLIPIVIMTAKTDRTSRLVGIESGADDFITKPFDEVELLARVRSLIRQKQMNDDLDNTAQVLFGIARAVESRDPTTGDHCERLVHLGQQFGEFLQLSPRLLKALSWGGYLHDIGKVGVPDSILRKPGRFSPDEWVIMQSHVIIGEEICKPLRTMQQVTPIIRHHHERWDGSGYPDGLKGEEIPLLVRVFQCLDIFDALTSARPYKAAMTPEQALDIMWQETRQGWRDPQLMEQFSAYIRSVPIGEVA